MTRHSKQLQKFKAKPNLHGCIRFASNAPAAFDAPPAVMCILSEAKCIRCQTRKFSTSAAQKSDAFYAPSRCKAKRARPEHPTRFCRVDHLSDDKSVDTFWCVDETRFRPVANRAGNATEPRFHLRLFHTTKKCAPKIHAWWQAFD